MEITRNLNGSNLELKIEGRVNSASAKQFGEALADIDDVTKIVLDFIDLAYISSAGLRVLLSTEKAMRARNGKMIIKNANEEIMETFEITGFVDFLTIE